MSDIHVLLAAETGDSIQVVFHFPVPDANNSVGVNYRTALVASGKGGTTTMTEGTGPGQIVSAEKTAIEAGEVYEHIRSISRAEIISGGTSPAQLLSTVRHFYAQDKIGYTDRLAQAPRYYGYTANEA